MDALLQQALRDLLQDPQRRAAALLSSGYQGSAYLYDSGHLKLVIKEAAAGLLMGWAHRLMLRREARMYALMQDVAGVPHSLGLLDDRYLILEFIDGQSLNDVRLDLRDKEQFYQRLRTIISAFHAADVAHGDLKRKDNVLVTADERPYVIDFGTAVSRHGSLWDRLMFRLVRRFDNNAWIKAKYDRDYASITPEDQQWYRPTILEKVFGALQRGWRVVTFRQARKRRQRKRQQAD